VPRHRHVAPDAEPAALSGRTAGQKGSMAALVLAILAGGGKNELVRRVAMAG